MFSLSKVSLRRVSIISGGLMKPLSCIIRPTSINTSLVFIRVQPYFVEPISSIGLKCFRNL